MRTLYAAVLGMCLVAAPAFAQEKPVEVNFGFGWAFPSTDFKKSFDAGWNGTIGATFFFRPNLGIQAEYAYDHMNGPTRNIDLFPTPVGGPITSGILESNHQIHAGIFNLVYRAHSADRPIGGYVLGGLGVFHRIIQVTTPSVGYGTYCDPYWLVCYPGLVSIDTIVGDRSSTDFGINFGGGVTLGHEAKFYVESRFTYVWGPTVSSSATATTYNTNATYYPLTFGFRF